MFMMMQSVINMCVENHCVLGRARVESKVRKDFTMTNDGEGPS